MPQKSLGLSIFLTQTHLKSETRQGYHLSGQPIFLLLSRMEGEMKESCTSALLEQTSGVPVLSAAVSRSHQSAAASCFPTGTAPALWGGAGTLQST